MTELTEAFEISPETVEKHHDGKAWPLPRLSSPHQSYDDRFEVIISGAGPAGTLLTLLLARYGLDGGSVLCVDSKPGPVDIGHADGFTSRTLEMLASLGLESEITSKGRRIADWSRWQRTTNGDFVRLSKQPMFFAAARFADLHTMHQGRFERLLVNDLRRYSKQGVIRNASVLNATLDEADKDFPILVNIRVGEEVRALRTKYLVGADGAHSVVRRSFDIPMVGENIDQIFGVCDFVPDTTFPDIRRAVTFYKNDLQAPPNALLVPREKTSDGHWLCRIYVDMSDETNKVASVVVGDENRDSVRQRKAQLKQDHVLERAAKLVAPYTLKVKEGTKPIWWATYCVGQRLADQFIVRDTRGHPRVFLVGDAAHTHSPRQGQGMNIGTQDAYYLSWRLAHVLLGLTPDPTKLLMTYESERRAWAHRVVTSDKRWNQEGMPFEVMFAEMAGQITGTGIEEKSSWVISEKNEAVAWQDKDLSTGILRTGRRFFNTKVLRFADGSPAYDIHKDFPSDGKYRILVLASRDFPHGVSRRAVESVCELVRVYTGLVEEVLLQPHQDQVFEWPDLPPIVKEQAEMRLHIASKEVYDIYGVDPEQGAIAVVRPDGIVAITTSLEMVADIKEMLQRLLFVPGSSR